MTAKMCVGAWGNETMSGENEIEWVQCSCKRNVFHSGERRGVLAFCEDHRCEKTEIAHFVASFLMRKMSNDMDDGRHSLSFDAKYNSNGQQKGKLSSGCIRIVSRGETILEVHLGNDDQCRDVFIKMSLECFCGVGGPPPQPHKLVGLNDESSSLLIGNAYNKHMRSLVWGRMKELEQTGVLPMLLASVLTSTCTPYHMAWHKRMTRADMVILSFGGDRGPSFIGWRLVLPPPLEPVDMIVGSCDGRYLLCDRNIKIELEIAKTTSMKGMIFHGPHPLGEPHHPPVLAVPAGAVVAPHGPDSVTSLNTALRRAVHDTAITGPTQVSIPSVCRVCPLRCRIESSFAWARIHIAENDECHTMEVLYLIRGGMLHVPIYDTMDQSHEMLIPCMLAPPEHIKPGLVCLVVVPPNIPIGWRSCGGKRRQAFVTVCTRGRGAMRRVYFSACDPYMEGNHT